MLCADETFICTVKVKHVFYCLFKTKKEFLKRLSFYYPFIFPTYHKINHKLCTLYSWFHKLDIISLLQLFSVVAVHTSLTCVKLDLKKKGYSVVLFYYSIFVRPCVSKPGIRVTSYQMRTCSGCLWMLEAGWAPCVSSTPPSQSTCCCLVLQWTLEDTRVRKHSGYINLPICLLFFRIVKTLLSFKHCSLIFWRFRLGQVDTGRRSLTPSSQVLSGSGRRGPPRVKCTIQVTK